MVRIGIVTASTRPRRIGHHITAWVTGLAPDDVELVPVDLREMALPLLDEPEMPSDGHYAHEHTRRWSEVVRGLDAMVLVRPEDNRGYTAPLKNAIDYLYAEWDGMPVACVGYGWSGAGYARAALRQTLDRVGMVVVDGAAAALREDPGPRRHGARRRGVPGGCTAHVCRPPHRRPDRPGRPRLPPIDWPRSAGKSGRHRSRDPREGGRPTAGARA